MAINRTSPKKGKVVDIPSTPTIGTATAGAESATVAFTAATVGGPATTYTALSSPGSFTGSGSSSPVTVSGLTAGTAYTFTVRGNNATGNSEYSSASNSVTPTEALTASFESIATYTVGSTAQTTITFSSIPQTYKHLQIRAIVKTDTGTTGFDDMWMTFNGRSDGVYSDHRILGNGSAVSAYGVAGETKIFFNSVAPRPSYSNTFGLAIIDVLDYQNVNKYKTVRSLNGCDTNGTGDVILQSGSFQLADAISSVSFALESAHKFVQYSQIALYGIKG